MAKLSRERILARRAIFVAAALAGAAAPACTTAQPCLKPSCPECDASALDSPADGPTDAGTKDGD